LLVGENGSGKSAIIDAVRRVLGTHSLDWNPIVDDDFFRDAMRLRIEITFEGMTDEQTSHFGTPQETEYYVRLRVIIRRSGDLEATKSANFDAALSTRR
jgi:putative ATP-dependent endonuclease of OLD family